MTLQGHAQGKSRKDLLRKAAEYAIEYYGTECVEITLSHETCNAEIIETTLGELPGSVAYHADWEAEEKHHMETLVYGPAKCRDCGKRNHEL